MISENVIEYSEELLAFHRNPVARRERVVYVPLSLCFVPSVVTLQIQPQANRPDSSTRIAGDYRRVWL